MKFESGKSNLRDIHNFMSKVDMVRSAVNTTSIKSKNFKRLIDIKISLNEVRREVNSYKNNLIKSRQFIDDYHKLNKTYLSPLVPESL